MFTLRGVAQLGTLGDGYRVRVYATGGFAFNSTRSYPRPCVSIPQEETSSGPMGRTVSIAQLASGLHEFLSCEGTARKKALQSTSTSYVNASTASRSVAVSSPSSSSSRRRHMTRSRMHALHRNCTRHTMSSRNEASLMKSWRICIALGSNTCVTLFTQVLAVRVLTDAWTELETRIAADLVLVAVHAVLLNARLGHRPMQMRVQAPHMSHWQFNVLAVAAAGRNFVHHGQFQPVRFDVCAERGG